MKVEFRNHHLEHLYTHGKDKKFPLPDQVIRKFFKVVGLLKGAVAVTDLWATPSLNFEQLKGFDHRYSVRLNQQYRLEMDIDWEDPDRTVGIIGLEDISNHYGG